MTRVIGRLVGAGLVLALAAPAMGVDVTFGSSTIEGRIRFLIDKPQDEGPVQDTDLEGLTELDVQGFFDVSDLTGLEFATDLERLYLGNNDIANLGPLSGLTNLVELKLDGNRISNLGPLSALTNLETLILGDNQIAAIDPLADLTGLRELDVSDNEIESIEAVAGLTHLRELDLENNFIMDASPLLDNEGIGFLTSVNLLGNSLATDSLCEVIRELEDRGANVQFDGECPGGIRGTVIGEAAGMPLDCAIVVATALSPQANDAIGPTDFDGHYAMASLRPAEYFLEVYAPGYEPVFRRVTISSFDDRTVNFELPAAPGNTVAITGAVSDMLTGLPLAGVNVTAFTASGVPVEGASVFTCAAGMYEVRVPATLKMVTLEFQAAGYINQEGQVVLAESQSRNAQLEPSNSFSGTVAGVVTDRLVGGGLEGARITVKQVGGQVAYTTLSNATGNYSVSNLSAGQYTLRFSTTTYPDEGITEQVTLGQGVTQVNAELGPEPPDPDPDPMECQNAAGPVGPLNPRGAAGDLAVFLGAGLALWWTRRKIVRA